jgi:hypothetical protein
MIDAQLTALQSKLVSKITILSDIFQRGDGAMCGIRTAKAFSDEIARYIEAHRDSIEILDE